MGALIFIAVVATAGAPPAQDAVPSNALPAPAVTYERTFPKPFVLLGMPAGAVAITDLYFVHTGGSVQAYEVASNRACWKRPVACSDAPRVVYLSPQQAVFATRYRLFAVALEDGSVLWHVGERPARADASDTDPEDFVTLRHTVFGGGGIVIARSDGEMMGVEAATGNVCWRGIMPDRPIAAPVTNGAFVAFPIRSGRAVSVVVLSGVTGARLSTCSLPGDLAVSRVALAGDALLVLSPTGIHAFAPATGEQLWALHFETLMPAEHLAIVGSAMYAPLDDRAIGKMDVATGRADWRTTLPFLSAFQNVHIAGEGRSVVVTTDLGIAILNSETGELLRALAFPETFRQEKTYIAANRFLVAGRDVATRQPVLMRESDTEGAIPAKLMNIPLSPFEFDWHTGRLCADMLIVRAADRVCGIRVGAN